jgi:hypothetical protein
VQFLTFPRIGRIAAADARARCLLGFHDYNAVGDDDENGMETRRRSMK